MDAVKKYRLRIVVVVVVVAAVLGLSGINVLLSHKDASINQEIAVDSSQEYTPEALGVSTVGQGNPPLIRVVSIMVSDGNTDDNLDKTSLEVTITNNDTSQILITPGLQFWIEDASGTVYPYTAEFLPSNKIVGGPLDSAKSMTMDLDFKLPSGVGPEVLKFQEDAASSVVEVKL